MADWSTLVQGLAAGGLHPSPEGADRISVTFSYEDGREQKVIAGRVRARNLDWCELLAAVGSVGVVQPAELLAINARTTLGGVCVQHGTYLLRQVVLLDSLTVADFDTYLRMVAGRADAIERSVFKQDGF